MSCNCDKNQTPDQVFDALKASKTAYRSAAVTGIGIFVVPAPEKGILEWKVVEVSGLSYEECMKRGANCESFQWLPLGLTVQASGKSVTINSVVDLAPLRDLCDDSCRGGCPMGCVCFNNDVRCQRN